MGNKASLRFYLLSIAILLALSVYPLANGARIAFLSIQNGVIEPGQYAKYVVPYAAICAAVILHALLEPLIAKLKRGSLPIGLALAYGAFFAIETFMEKIQVNTAGMTLVDPQTLTTGGVSVAPGSVDIWQAALCVASPAVKLQSIAFASGNSFYYVMESNAYKVHYYMISLILVSMICVLVYGIGKMLREGGQKTPLVLQGISTSMLIGLCVFANTTAFFRQTEPIQTPLASLLTCLFFVCLGSTVGIYSGSFLLAKRSAARIGLPVALAMLATIAMYFGEAVMMKDSLYRFGTGFFFDGLPAVSLAPADILVILLSGAIAWLVLAVSGKHAPGLKASLAAVLVSATIAISGAALASSPEVVDIFKVYRFSECLYMSPFSSLFMPPGKALPIVYSLREDSFLEFNTATGDIRSLQASFEKTPIRNSDFPSDILKSAPDISSYKKKYLVATLSDGQRLYQMDGEIWLVKVNEPYLWSIYLLEPTDSVSFEDLERSQAIQEEAFSTPDIREMTCKDLYALARKGKNLTLKDFEMFEYKLTGADLSVRLYHVEGGNTLTISGGEELGKIDLLSYRTQDGSKSIDLRDGFDEVASYLSPMNSLYDFTIEDEGAQAQGREELIYEYEYDECRYYLLNFDSSKLFAVFSSGERMPLKQAFEERRFVVEDVLARGYSMRIIPSSNPLGGEFTAHRNWVVFTLNKEKFYPSKSFMYLIDEGLVTYFDVSELADILSWYGYDEASKKLQDFAKSGATQSIARKSYIAEKDLASLDISVVIGWMISSHTPIEFIVSP